MSERKLFAHELEARLDELLLLSLRQRSAAEPAALLEDLPRELQERVLHWAGVAAQTSDDLGWLIASLAATQKGEYAKVGKLTLQAAELNRAIKALEGQIAYLR